MALDSSLKNIFAVSELRNRVLFTLALLGVFRIGGRIVTPGVDIRALEEFALQLGKNSMFGLYDMFTGGNLAKVTIFALGIMPYISSSSAARFTPGVVMLCPTRYTASSPSV